MSLRERARPLWSILADAGLHVGVVRWSLTFPAPEVPGILEGLKGKTGVRSFEGNEHLLPHRSAVFCQVQPEHPHPAPLQIRE